MSDADRAGYLFATCQMGAEAALKAEVARRWPAFHLAFSRPGFVTFKLPADHPLVADFDLMCVFARAYGFSLGKVAGDETESMAREVWQLAAGLSPGAVHVWQRDTATPGFRRFEPGPTPLAELVRDSVLAGAPLAAALPDAALPDATLPDATLPDAAAHEGPLPNGRSVEWLPSFAPRGATVLDVVVVEPTLWWVGYHRAAGWTSRWPGGMLPGELPPHAVSRAYLKMSEALSWSRFPLCAGDVCVELGYAPGGAAQALLDQGAIVLGVDPAEVDPAVLAHPNFRHVRKRGKEVRRSELAAVTWLAADMNVAPNYTLDTVEAIVTHPKVHVQGLLLTLKLNEWRMSENIAGYLDRIRSWGFHDVRARHLVHNRQEICVAALRHRSLRRVRGAGVKQRGGQDAATPAANNP